MSLEILLQIETEIEIEITKYVAILIMGFGVSLGLHKDQLQELDLVHVTETSRLRSNPDSPQFHPKHHNENSKQERLHFKQ